MILVEKDINLESGSYGYIFNLIRRVKDVLFLSEIISKEIGLKRDILHSIKTS